MSKNESFFRTLFLSEFIVFILKVKILSPIFFLCYHRKFNLKVSYNLIKVSYLWFVIFCCRFHTVVPTVFFVRLTKSSFPNATSGVSDVTTSNISSIARLLPSSIRLFELTDPRF